MKWKPSRSTWAATFALLTLALVMITVVPRLAAQATPAGAALPGMATLSGSVTAASPFKAAQVYIYSPERRMLYMVYTNAGKYRAVAIVPGSYEVSVTASGSLSSEVQKVTLKAGDKGSVSLKLEPTPADTNARNAPWGGSASRLRPTNATLTFDQIYPQDPALPILQRTCISCHGPNFLPNQQWNERQWRAAMDRMFGPVGDEDKRKSPTVAEDGTITRGVLTAAEREILVPYLVKNFGPDSQRRRVKFENEMQVDEAKLANAMYIEYHVPPDPPGQLSTQKEYQGINQGRNRYTQDPSFDPEGNVWLSERGFPNRLVRLNPLTGEYKDFYPPDPLNGMHDIRVGKDGMVWVPEHAGLPDRGKAVKHLNRFNPRTEKWEGRYALDPDNVIKTNNGTKWAQSLAIDSKGNVYVGWINGGALSKWDKATGKVTVHIPPTRTLNMYGVVPDKDDNIWVSLWTAGVIAKFDTKTNKWTEYRPPTPNAVIRRPQVDADNNVWFGIYAAGKRPGKLVKLETKTGKMTEWTFPWDASEPYDVNPDPFGNIWITDSGQGGTLVKFNPKDGSFTPYPSPQGADKPSIEVTRDGAIWYSPRGVDRTTVKYPGLGVLYPDMDKIKTLAAFPGQRHGG
jgi:streptogramin lyase